MNKKTKRALALAKREAFLKEERERGLQYQKAGRTEDAQRKQLREAKAALKDSSLNTPDRFDGPDEAQRIVDNHGNETPTNA